MTQIMNGGIYGGILAAIGRENITPEDRERLDYLESLPRNQWISLGDDGKAISDEEAESQLREHLSRFTPTNQQEI